MGRRCTVCTHPDVEEINRHIITGNMKQTEIAERYGVSKYAITRHKKNHLQPEIDKIQEKVKDKIEVDYLETLKAYNMIINRLPDVITNNDPTFNQILNAIEARSNLLGESLGKPQIEITWGLGTNDDEDKHPTEEEEERQEVLAELENYARESKGN